MTPARRHPTSNPVSTGVPQPGHGWAVAAHAADPLLMVQLTSPMPPEPGVTSTVIQRAAQLPQTWAALKAPPSS